VFVDGRRFSMESGIPVATLRTKRTRGGGPPFYRVGRSIKYDLDEGLAWVRTRRATSTSDADQRERIRAQSGHHSLTE
jgi:hypothetical protein